MKRIVIALTASTLLLSGCETKTGTGALVGGVVGATTGAVIKPSATGAAVGAVTGALAGGLIGNSLDRENLRRHSPRTLRKIEKGEQLSIYDIKRMSEAGVDSREIISLIKATHSRFNLTSADIMDLKKVKVSQNVIDVMLGY